MPYQHRVPTENLAAFLRDELPRISQAIDAPVEARQWKVLYAEPTKYSAGMVVYADGTTWNPGSGEGLYVRTSSAWVKL